jgi:integrase
MEMIMPKSTLTGALIRKKSANPNQYFIWDKKTKGFGLKVTPSEKKIFVINITRLGRRYTENIGEWPHLSLREARKIAKNRLEHIKAQNKIGAETKFEVMAEFTFCRKERLWKPGTIYVNKGYLNNNILPFFKGKPIGEITRIDVENWFASLKYKPASANRSLPVLSNIMIEAEEEGARPWGSNPAIGLRRYRASLKERVLSSVEMARLWDGLQRKKKKYPLYVACLMLLILTGCRKGELYSLRWHHYREGKLFLPDSKSGPRTIYLCSHARAVLDELKKKGKFVFPPKEFNKHNFEFFWRNFRAEIDLNDVRLHDFRHNYASIAMRNGENLQVLGKLLGHIQIETTNRYTHFNDQDMRDYVQIVNSAMMKKGEQDNES